MFQFNYTLSEKDYYDFNEYHLLNSPMNKKGILFYCILLPVLLASMILFFWLRYQNFIQILIMIIAASILSALWILFLLKKLLLLNMKSQIKRIKKLGKVVWGVETAVSFGEEFISDISELGESKFKYSVVEKIAVGKTAVYVYIEALRALILPFPVFESEEQKQEFLSFINNKIRNKDLSL